MRGNLWGPEAPPEEAAIEVLVYRSRLLGADPELVVWGGGNTSLKTIERDHLGRERAVLRIKGSGTDLKSIDRAGFPGVYLEDVLALLQREEMSDEKMVAYLERCMVEPGGKRPSIETLLHAFLPARHVDHTHADAIVALTNAPGGREAVREALGERVAWVAYRRPGFRLSREVYEAAQQADAIVLANHGTVTWGDTARESYEATIDLVERAERWLAGRTVKRTYAAPAPAPLELERLLPRLRGRLGHVVLRTLRAEPYRELAGRPDIAALADAGPATADHVLRIRPWALVLGDEQPAAQVDAWAARYRAWFEAHSDGSLPMLTPLPKIFLVPGVGMVAAGKDAREAEVAAEVALHTLQVAARGTDAHGQYRSLSDEDLFQVDYWPLELYKLSLAPPPRELQGRVALVTGAASGIGRVVAQHLAGLGAQLALLDLNGEGLAETAAAITAAGAAQPLSLTLDLTEEAAVTAAIRAVVEAFGGIDVLVSNAGVPAAGTLDRLTAEEWRRSLEVNATSHFLITQAALRVMREQGLGGSIVYVASKNAFAPGAGFGAYSAAKAAQVQLARITALEGGPIGVRANIVNPDAVFEGSGLWSDEVRRERAAVHGVPVEALEDFYAQRNLLKTRIGGQDVAEAVAFLASDRSRATTGTVLTVDGGVAGAFPR